MITQEEIISIQRKWADGLIQLGSLQGDRERCLKAAGDFVERMYAYDEGSVLFKPTRARKHQFRLDKESAISYFVKGKYAEDKGFALLDWTDVRFENAGFILEKDRAFAMGNYFFKDTQGNEVKAEFTFGYIRTENGDLKINIHHSSRPDAHPKI